MALTLLNQFFQIKQSDTYDDAIVDSHTVGVAEAQTRLEGDLNVIRTRLKALLGTSDWYLDGADTIADLDSRATAIEDKRFIKKVRTDVLTAANSYFSDVSGLDINAVDVFVDESGTDLGMLADLPVTQVAGSTVVINADATITDASADFVTDGVAVGNIIVVDDGTNFFASTVASITDLNNLEMADAANFATSTGNITIIDHTSEATVLLQNDGTNDPIDDGAGNQVKAFLIVDNLATPTYERFYYYSVVSDVVTPHDLTSQDIEAFVWKQYKYLTLPRNLDTQLVHSNLAEEVNIGDRTYSQDFVLTDKESITSSLDALDSQAKITIESLIGQLAGETSMTYTSQDIITNGDAIDTALGLLDAAIGTQDYATNNYVADLDDSTVAIGKLDAALKALADILADGVSVYRDSAPAAVTSGSNYQIPGTPDIDATKHVLYVNGLAWQLGQDYSVADAATGLLTFNRTMPANGNIIFTNFA